MPMSDYSAKIFDVADKQSAASIILTPDDENSTEERWIKETPYLLDLMEMKGFAPGENDLVLDYGCGIGRMSLAMIDRFKCRVIGVDISPSMQHLAMEYVDSSKFTPLSPDQFEYLVKEKKLRVDFAISIWVIQHVAKPQAVIRSIDNAMASGASFFVVNELRRLVPTVEHKWLDDDIDVKQILATTFLREKNDGGVLDPSIVTQVVSDRTFWGIYR